MDIEQLVKATAEAVATLAGLVEGLPRAMDVKLAAYQSSLKDAVATVNEQVEAMNAQITALGVRIDDTVKMVVTAESGLVKMLEGAKTEAASQVAGVRSLVDGVQASLAGFANADAVLASTDELKISIDDIENRVAGMDKRITEIGVEVDKRVVEVSAELADAVAESTEREVALRSTIEVIDLRSSEAMTMAKTTLQAQDEYDKQAVEFNKIIGGVREEIAVVAASVETNMQAVRAGALEEIGTVRSALEDRIEVNVGALSALTAKVDNTVKETTGLLANVESALRQSDEEIIERVGELALLWQPVDARISKLTSDLDETSTRLENTVAGIAAIGPVISASAEAVREELGKDLGTLENELRGHIGAATDGLRAEMEEGFKKTGLDIITASEGVQAAGEQIAAMQAVVAAKADASTVDALREDIDAVSRAHDELVKAMPAPVDATELEVRITSKLAELIPEHASLELPAPELDAYFEGGVLTVAVTMGEKKALATMEVPVNFDYKGVYDKAKNYAVGNLVTHKGSIWYAKSKPTGEPGKDITGWQLAVKSGRDGKDATPTRAYDGHESGRVYRETDFLRVNNRLWQCAVKETSGVPEPGDITSTNEWTLIGGVH